MRTPGTERHADGSQTASQDTFVAQVHRSWTLRESWLKMVPWLEVWSHCWILFARVVMWVSFWDPILCDSGLKWCEVSILTSSPEVSSVNWCRRTPSSQWRFWRSPTMSTLGLNGHWIVSYVFMMTVKAKTQFDAEKLWTQWQKIAPW